ncbi:MAG: hypothetical protein KJ717_01775, partial [Proteobacteria bacterium]|nr:hypothetical protein [Pseudomonadota bacterium]
MDPSFLIPAPDPIPVNWFFLQFLLTITTFLHLVAMNVLLGSACVALAAPLAGPDEQTGPLCRKIGEKLPYVMAFTINFGVAPLLFLQVLYGQFFYTSSILMAGYWLAIIGLLIVTYYAAYIYHLRYEDLGPVRSLLTGAIVLLLVVVAFFFCNNMSIMQLPESWVRYFSGGRGWQLHFSDPTLVPRFLHFIASAVAVGGLAIAVYYEHRRRQGDGSGERWIKYGCNWFTIATLINFPIGFWFLGVLPSFAHNATTLAGKLFTVSLYGSLALAVISVIQAQRHRVYPAVGWALGAIFFMTLAREFVRIAYLNPYFSLADLPVAPQYSPMIVFLIFLILAGTLVWWMVKTV